jgi:hypothetical protein
MRLVGPQPPGAARYSPLSGSLHAFLSHLPDPHLITAGPIGFELRIYALQPAPNTLDEMIVPLARDTADFASFIGAQALEKLPPVAQEPPSASKHGIDPVQQPRLLSIGRKSSFAWLRPLLARRLLAAVCLGIDLRNASAA